MANTVQLTKNGQPVFPVTDVSLVMGLQDAIKLHPVKVATLPTASADTAGKMYYVGPTDGEYERYITSAVNGSYEWIDLGNTAIPLPSIADNLTTNDPQTALSAAQGVVLDGKISQLQQGVYGIDTLTLPEGLKTLNWEQANHSRKVWYEDGALNFKVVGVSACNIVQANSSANQQEDCWKEVNTEFWNSDAPLILKVRYNLAQPTIILIGYKKGSISRSHGSSDYLINATGEGEIEIDVKELLKRDNSTSYQLISFVTPHSIAAQGESYGTNEVRVYGFEEEVEGDIQRIDGEVSELRNSVGSKQNILVSGENIKTLNGESILGAGDIVIKSNDMVSLASVLQLRANLPSYYTEQPSDPTSYDDDSYIDVKVDSVPDGKKFIFFTDSHWDYYVGNPKTSPALIAYVRNRLNIRNVIFGGDFIDVKDTKYLAKQVLGDFAYKCLAAFGSGFLPVMGNHDNNLAGQDISDPDVVASHYLPNDVVYDVMFKNAVKPNGNYWDDNKTTLLSMAQTAGFSEDDIADLEGECRMDYWYDDPVHGIRYIVHNTETPHVTPMWRLFDTATTPYMVWLYNVLCSTPAGYDVCLAVHMLGSPNTTPQEDDLALRQLTSLLMGLKTRTAKEFYISRRNDNCTTMWPWTRHTLDFTQCNPVGKVFVIAGHDHGDAISIANQSTTTFNIVQVSTYDGVSTIDQTTIQPNNGCSIPIIWTATNSLRGASGGGSGIKGDRPPGENGTVTEQIFDVFSIQDDGIRITRVGAGSDRTLLING